MATSACTSYEQAQKADAIEGKCPAVSVYSTDVDRSEGYDSDAVGDELVEVPQDEGSIKEFFRAVGFGSDSTTC